MAQVLEERVDVGTLKGDYQFGFHDPDQSVFRTRKGLDRESIELISAIKAFDMFLQKPMPAWDGNVAKMKTDGIVNLMAETEESGNLF